MGLVSVLSTTGLLGFHFVINHGGWSGAPKNWIFLFHFYIHFFGIYLSKTTSDLKISGRNLLFTSCGLTKVKIQYLNHREPESAASRNDLIPFSSRTVLGCRLLTNA